MADGEDFVFCGRPVALGESRDFRVPVSESYSGGRVTIPVRVRRGAEPGPALFVTAAVHGDEINGVGVVRAIISDPEIELLRGTLVLVPVVNILGFERLTRYLPDRRDLNRAFPGSPSGSLASRYAHRVFTEIVEKCDYGIDLHTGAVRRTNFANIRGDLSNPEVENLARFFGCELMINGKGPQGSLRRAACKAGCPTIILEGGEVWKIEPAYVEVAVRGIYNVMIHLEMIDATPRHASYQTRVDETKWVRSNTGGVLHFHVAPGSVVDEGQALATCSDLLGENPKVINAPVPGVVMGMTTLPTVKPGDPICHLAVPEIGIEAIRRRLVSLEHRPGESLEERLRGDLASNVTVGEFED